MIGAVVLAVALATAPFPARPIAADTLPGDSATVPPPSPSRDSVVRFDAPAGVSRAVAPSPAQVADVAYSWCGSPRGRTISRIVAGTAFTATNLVLWDYLKQQWWNGERSDRFWVHYDWGEDWHDQDKFGHLLGGYQLTRVGTEVLQSACISRKTAAVWAYVYSNAFQFQIEMLDATQKEYGFSPADMLFNVTGSTLRLSQEFFPVMRHIKPTFSYWPSGAMWKVIRKEAVNPYLHATIDYSGQTYWFSFDVDSLLPKQAADVWPGFLRVSLGAGITDWVDPNTATSRYFARRRWLLSLDLDVGKLPGDHPVWKAIKENLSYVHIMGPAIQLWPKPDAYLLYR